ncbi:hypothetical protein D3C87_1815300 [compost metagenome]
MATADRELLMFLPSASLEPCRQRASCRVQPQWAGRTPRTSVRIRLSNMLALCPTTKVSLQSMDRATLRR